ncbi:MAG: DUF1122 family protein [Candidatus Bathyarchaeota archaeon]
MVAYQMFQGRSNLHKETERLLQQDIQPELTPIGFLLINAGCLALKDWYWPEGGCEGPQKLQGFKPINQEQAQANVERLCSKLEDVLSREAEKEVFKGVWKRAENELALLRSSN